MNIPTQQLSRPVDRLRALLLFLYGERARDVYPALMARLDEFKRRHPGLQGQLPELTERDAILITYADSLQQRDQAPLHTLAEFLDTFLSGAINGVHLLPFFPYSSDDGFSVIDYRQVDPHLGSWDDIERLGQKYRLVFDAVINHVSAESRWFQGFLRGEDPYRHYFFQAEPSPHLDQVVRPRALPLLTQVETASGPAHVWTTFSADQVDLNYANPDVLLEIVDLLLFYAARGAQILRLDAIAYLWKEPGTSCIHLPQTHAMVKVFRAALDYAAPAVLLLTETNVPHAENIRYFGRSLPGRASTDEAQLVYAFPLAPLVLHAFRTGQAGELAAWAASLRPTAPGTSYFNFIASHDGIGLRPAEGLLTPAEIQALADQALAHGGQVSSKADPGGGSSPYELNITLFDALNNPANPRSSLNTPRFLAAQAIMLSLAGVPGIYLHSLFGSSNCDECYRRTGRARSLNREKLELSSLLAALQNARSRQAQVFSAYRRMLAVRCAAPAFHPAAPQQVLPLDERIFALRRTPPDGSPVLLALVNVSSQPVQLPLPTGAPYHDLLTRLPAQHTLRLAPYQFAWLIESIE